MAGSFRNTDEYVIRYRPKVMDTRRNTPTIQTDILDEGNVIIKM